MKKLSRIVLGVALLLVTLYGYTQNPSSPGAWSSPIPWKADPSNTLPGNDTVTIQTERGVHAQAQISIDHKGAGAILTNCGSTTRLSPGSTAICVIDDPDAPVTISSDTLNRATVGTYQIKTH